MANATDILENNYNLTRLFNNNPIDNPTQWLADYNQIMQNYFIVSLLAVFGLALFFLIKQRADTSDSEAVVYAGL